MAKTKEKEHKSRKKLSRTAKENWAIGIVALLILSVVVYECYTATPVSYTHLTLPTNSRV